MATGTSPVGGPQGRHASRVTPDAEAMLPATTVLAILRRGTLELAAYVPWSSNATLLVRVHHRQRSLEAVYKPRSGERPLWDFPRGSLCQREVAAYHLSQALGWHLVPPTVLRRGPLGLGAVQAFVPHDPATHYLVMDDLAPRVVERIVAFDVVANNADRKSGHVLRDPQGDIWLIDHGLTFHVEWKLRTVIWELAGEPLPPHVQRDLRRLLAALDQEGSALRRRLGRLLSAAEVEALRHRTLGLLQRARYPCLDRERRAVPWPLV